MAKRKSGQQPSNLLYQVFISHATADKWLATTLCEKVEQIPGATTFRDDRDIGGGDDIPESIRKELKLSRELLVLLTPDSVNRPWVLLEVGAFWGNRRAARIVPILCHVNFDSIPDMLKSKKSISLNNFDEYLAELRARVQRGHS